MKMMNQKQQKPTTPKRDGDNKESRLKNDRIKYKKKVCETSLSLCVTKKVFSDGKSMRLNFYRRKMSSVAPRNVHFGYFTLFFQRK
jgi:hypothetical protein